MSRPPVSVLVNNFNYGDFVGAAIDSALAEGPEVEVVVVDDGSSDHSRSVIESYGGEIIAVLQENGGQGAAFNTGFAASSGEIVIFLDADDVLAPGAVATIRTALADPAVAKLHWSLGEIDRDGSRTGALRPEILMPEGDLRQRMVDYGPLGHSNPPTSGNAFARRVLEQMMPMPEDEYRICADAYLVMLASIYGELRRSLVPLSYWRRHGDNRYNGTRETIAERAAADLDRYEALAATLAVHLEAQGTRVDADVWRQRNNGYRRLERLRSTCREIESVVPEGDAFVLVDDGDWSQGHLEGRELLRNRTNLALFDGDVLDEPPSESVLLAEVERLQRVGATHIVFVWPGTWWLRHYPGLEAYLKARGAPLGGGLVGYELGGGASADGERGERPLPRLPRDADLPARHAQLVELDRRIEQLQGSIAELDETIAAAGASRR